MKFFRFFVVALLLALPGAAFAQSAAKQPSVATSGAWVDLGNGPTEVLPIEGNGNLYTRGSTGVGSTSGSSTALTLTAVPTYAPCVGCAITGTGITGGTTVSAFNGVTSVTLSAAMTVASSTALAWGVACPTSGVPPSNAATSSPINMRSSASPTRFPIYSYARVCAYGGAQTGAVMLNFPIGNW